MNYCQASVQYVAYAYPKAASAQSFAVWRKLQEEVLPHVREPASRQQPKRAPVSLDAIQVGPQPAGAARAAVKLGPPIEFCAGAGDFVFDEDDGE